MVCVYYATKFAHSCFWDYLGIMSIKKNRESGQMYKNCKQSIDSGHKVQRGEKVRHCSFISKCL